MASTEPFPLNFPKEASRSSGRLLPLHTDTPTGRHEHVGDLLRRPPWSPAGAVETGTARAEPHREREREDAVNILNCQALDENWEQDLPRFSIGHLDVAPRFSWHSAMEVSQCKSDGIVFIKCSRRGFEVPDVSFFEGRGVLPFSLGDPVRPSLHPYTWSVVRIQADKVGQHVTWRGPFCPKKANWFGRWAPFRCRASSAHLT